MARTSQQDTRARRECEEREEGAGEGVEVEGVEVKGVEAGAGEEAGGRGGAGG